MNLLEAVVVETSISVAVNVVVVAAAVTVIVPLVTVTGSAVMVTEGAVTVTTSAVTVIGSAVAVTGGAVTVTVAPVVVTAAAVTVTWLAAVMVTALVTVEVDGATGYLVEQNDCAAGTVDNGASTAYMPLVHTVAAACTLRSAVLNASRTTIECIVSLSDVQSKKCEMCAVDVSQKAVHEVNAACSQNLPTFI